MDKEMKLMSVAEAKKKYGGNLISLKMTTKKAYDLSFDDVVKGASVFASMTLVAVEIGKYTSTAYMVDEFVIERGKKSKRRNSR